MPVQARLQGTYAFANCGKVRFNDGVSWPVMAGHGCMGCTEPAFWDTMAPLEKPIEDIPSEHTIDAIGAVLLGVTAAGIAAHAGLTAIRHREKKAE